MGFIIDAIQFLLILGIGFLWFQLSGKIRDPQKEKVTVAELEKIAKKMKTEVETARRDVEKASIRAEKLETRVYLLESSTGESDEDSEF